MTAENTLDVAAPAVTTVDFHAENPDAATAVLTGCVGRVSAAVGGAQLMPGATPFACDFALPGGASLSIVVGRPRPERAFSLSTYTLSALAGGGGAEVEAALAALRRVPLTAFEMGELRRQMPLTVGMAQQLPPGAFGNVAPVLVIHHMLDFLVMVDVVTGLGVPPELVTVLDKRYAYRHTERVDAHLRAAGIVVHPFEQAPTVLPEHIARGRTAGRRTLLIDDGGYTLPALLDHHPNLLDEVVGLVEQTKSGIFRLERFAGRLPTPIFSVAESRLKATVETWGIADAAARNIMALLPDEKWEGQAALVLGFGRIGAQVADVLRSRRMRVAVYDPDPVTLVAAHEQGFLTARSVCDPMAAHQPLLIVGTSGRTSLLGEHIDGLDRDAYVVSLTSRQREIALDELAELAVRQEDLGRLGLRYMLPGGRRLTVLADGYPVNFHWAESLPNKYSDIVLASMLAGAATLAAPGHGFAAGHNVGATDAVLTRSGLAEGYYQIYGPGRP